MIGRKTSHLAALLVFALFCAACATTQNPRKAEIASVFVSADAKLFRDRPKLVEGKYARMAKDPYAFFRGSVPLFQHDWDKDNFHLRSSKFWYDKPIVSFGDAHPENFGTLFERDESRVVVLPNDFDNLGARPYLWDVRRLAIGMALAARLSVDGEEGKKASLGAAWGVAHYYTHGLRLYRELDRLFSIKGGNELQRDLILADLFERTRKDRSSSKNMDELTLLAGKSRRVRRGAIESDRLLVDLPKGALASLPEAISRYREGLDNPPPPEFFTLLDAAREIGSGVGSFPRIRVVVLVRGETDAPSDDVVLELKELPDSIKVDDLRAYAKNLFNGNVAPLWGATEWMGLVCQIKSDNSAQKTIRISRFKKERGTPEAIAELGYNLSQLLVTVHQYADTNDELYTHAINELFSKGNDSVFVDEQVALANVYVEQILTDFELFREALRDLGPSLGAERGPGDPSMSPDLRALIADDLVPSP